jgi:chromosome segregation ATPase
MIEPIMYFGIGFLFATLLGLVIIPLVHNRAVRLTTRRFEASTPVSMAEIQADKDQLRAEFAMSTRRLEMSVDQLKAKTTSQLAELGKKTDAISRLKNELGEKSATILALEAREKSLREQIRGTEEEYSVKTNAMYTAERTLAEKESDLSKLTAELNERTFLSDSQRVEIIALRTQVEALRSQIDRFDVDVKDAEQRLQRDRLDADTAAKELAEERSKVGGLVGRADELQRQLVAQVTEAEILNRRVQELESRLGEQGRVLAEREYEVSHLRTELEDAHRTETDLRAEVIAFKDQRSANDHLQAEKQMVERELDQTREERAKLQRDIAAMQREAEATWAAERVENALLRERINDIATEVARLTMALEGPGSPIEAMLAGDTSAARSEPAQPARKGASSSKRKDETEGGSLADRIRALQARASRVSPAT